MAVNIGKLVLVIDDEPDLRLFIRTVLEDAGFEVAVAGNGKEALERMTERKPMSYRWILSCRRCPD
jgi:CheY-like chemotaxis protein